VRRLNAKWAIDTAGTPPVDVGDGEVADVEELIWGVIAPLRASASLTPDDELELFSHLLEETVKLIPRFNPRAGATVLFRPWLFQRLRGKAIDWCRTFYGRRGQKRVLDSRRLDAARRDSGYDEGFVEHEQAGPERMEPEHALCVLGLWSASENAA
jgi:hypothetical protein